MELTSEMRRLPEMVLHVPVPAAMVGPAGDWLVPVRRKMPPSLPRSTLPLESKTRDRVSAWGVDWSVVSWVTSTPLVLKLSTNRLACDPDATPALMRKIWAVNGELVVRSPPT